MRTLFKQFIISVIILLTGSPLFAQIHTNQNGVQTSVTNTLYADAWQARRYEIATVAINSYHWQHGGAIIIELFEHYYGIGYEKYVIESGFGQGANSGTPKISLIESHGAYHTGRVSLGALYDLSSSYAGYVNKAMPVYMDVRAYGGYKAKITYLQNKVDVLDYFNQIKINENPQGTNIDDFSAPVALTTDISSSGNLRITGVGDHYIENGNMGIGTTNTRNYRLAVNGSIRAQEIKVEASPWPDYVFGSAYQLPDLKATEQFIKANKHLPEIPSAAEVEKDGVNLGEMNAKLLKKIEELTLHLIEQNKELIDAKSKIHDLTNRMDALSSPKKNP